MAFPGTTRAQSVAALIGLGASAGSLFVVQHTRMVVGPGGAGSRFEPSSFSACGSRSLRRRDTAVSSASLTVEPPCLAKTGPIVALEPV